MIILIEYNLNCDIFRGNYDSKLNAFYGETNVTTVNSEIEAEKFKDKNCVIVEGKWVGGDYELYAYPIINGKIKKGMFGGQFIYTSDSRLPDSKPIRLMDRFET